jgi:hemolysin III
MSVGNVGVAGDELLPPKPRLRGLSHLYAFFVALVAAVALVLSAPPGTATVGAVVYAVALVAMFGVSALYHRGSWRPVAARRMLQLDHTAIFVMIAGTCTPIGLLAVHGTPAAVFLTVVWAAAACGIAFEWLPVPAPRGYVTAVYLTLGWVGVFAFVPLLHNAGAACVVLVAAGGLCYTAGAIVHAARRPDPFPLVFGYHEIFHLLVIGAAVLHYVAIAAFVLPLGS